MIEGINIGICESRIQFFVNWKESGENKYVFLNFRYRIEQLKNHLEEAQANNQGSESFIKYFPSEKKK